MGNKEFDAPGLVLQASDMYPGWMEAVCWVCRDLWQTATAARPLPTAMQWSLNGRDAQNLPAEHGRRQMSGSADLRGRKKKKELR